MSGKDVLKLLLISYGFCRNLKVEMYKADYGVTGYDVSAWNDDGLHYKERDCEGLMFHINEIIEYMEEHKVCARLLNADFSIKDILDDEKRSNILKMKGNEHFCRTNPYRL